MLIAHSPRLTTPSRNVSGNRWPPFERDLPFPAIYAKSLVPVLGTCGIDYPEHKVADFPNLSDAPRLDRRDKHHSMNAHRQSPLILPPQNFLKCEYYPDKSTKLDAMAPNVIRHIGP